MQKKIYDLILPLGANCGASMWLRALDLQQASYPFDWVTGVGFATKADLIIKNFQGYLLLQNLAFIDKTPDEPQNPCDVYQNTANGMLFVHDFKAGKPLAETYDAVATKYIRRIARLYQDINSANKILFFWFTRLETEQTPNQTLLKYQEKLSQKLGKEVDLLLLENDPSKTGTQQMEQFVLSPHITRYRLDTATTALKGHEVLGNALSIEPLLRPYRLNQPVYIRLWRKIKGPCIRLASLLAPNTAARKAFRRKYYPEYEYRKGLRMVHQALQHNQAR